MNVLSHAAISVETLLQLFPYQNNCCRKALELAVLFQPPHLPFDHKPKNCGKIQSNYYHAMILRAHEKGKICWSNLTDVRYTKKAQRQLALWLLEPQSFGDSSGEKERFWWGETQLLWVFFHKCFQRETADSSWSSSSSTSWTRQVQLYQASWGAKRIEKCIKARAGGGIAAATTSTMSRRLRKCTRGYKSL